jgi:two-component system, OmpR family, response regulator
LATTKRVNSGLKERKGCPVRYTCLPGSVTSRIERIASIPESNKVPSGLPKTRVLVVDDDEDMRTLLTLSLESFEYEVETANGANEALEAIDRRRPDVIVLDVMMPGITGIELLGILRGRSDTNVTPVLFYTCLDTADVAEAAASAGNTAALTKPASPTQLNAALAALAGRS